MRDGKKTAAVVLAGGKGSRMQSDVPKQYINVCGHPLIYYCLQTFENSFIDEIILVCGAGDEEYCKSNIVLKYGFTKVSHIVTGGKERYHSVANGLKAINGCDIVFIHDGARPFVGFDVLDRAFADATVYGSGVVAVPSKDTVKIADEEGFAITTPNRSSVYMMQTPQTFKYSDIMAAYLKLIDEELDVKSKGVTITDDAMVMEYFGDAKIKLTEGDYRNLKVTTPEDILIAEAYINNFYKNE